jgi:hypothetical protein
VKPQVGCTKSVGRPCRELRRHSAQRPSRRRPLQSTFALSALMVANDVAQVAPGRHLAPGGLPPAVSHAGPDQCVRPMYPRGPPRPRRTPQHGRGRVFTSRPWGPRAGEHTATTPRPRVVSRPSSIAHPDGAGSRGSGTPPTRADGEHDRPRVTCRPASHGCRSAEYATAARDPIRDRRLEAGHRDPRRRLLVDGEQAHRLAVVRRRGGGHSRVVPTERGGDERRQDAGAAARRASRRPPALGSHVG